MTIELTDAQMADLQVKMSKFRAELVRMAGIVSEGMGETEITSEHVAVAKKYMEQFQEQHGRDYFLYGKVAEFGYCRGFASLGGIVDPCCLQWSDMLAAWRAGRGF